MCFFSSCHRTVRPMKNQHRLHPRYSMATMIRHHRCRPRPITLTIIRVPNSRVEVTITYRLVTSNRISSRKTDRRNPPPPLPVVTISTTFLACQQYLTICPILIIKINKTTMTTPDLSNSTIWLDVLRI